MTLNIRKVVVQIKQSLEQDYLRWMLWAPIAFGSGILLYVYHQNVRLWILSICALGLLWGWKQWHHEDLLIRFLLRGVFCVSAGCLLADFSAPPPLFQSLKTPVWLEGQICGLQHLATTERLIQRVALNHIQLPTKEGVDPAQKVVIKIQTENNPLYEGDWVRVLAGFYPENVKGLPQDAFLKRHQWLEQIIAYGYALCEPIVEKRNNNRLDIWRHSLTRLFHQKLKPPLGAMACALFTGDKAALPKPVKEAFSCSGLSHLLAISGLHLSAVTAGCFFVLIRLFCFIPSLALYVNLQKWAAFLSCVLGALYLKISGQGYPAQRAFWMMVFAMMGILFNRRTISIRVVMLCALSFLCIQPFCVFSISFQLSFAAVISLIAFFENPFSKNSSSSFEIFSDKAHPALRRCFLWLKQSLASSAMAGVLTLPLIAFYFHQISLQMFITNFIAIPLTTFLILPLGILCCISFLTPFSDIFLIPFSLTLSALLNLALFSSQWLSSLVLNIYPFSIWILLVQLFAGLWWILWKSSMRWIGFFVFLGTSALIFFPPQESYFLLHVGSRMLIYCDAHNDCVWRYPLASRSKIAQEWCRFLGYSSLNKLLPNNVVFLVDGQKAFIGESIPKEWPRCDFFVFWQTAPLPKTGVNAESVLFCDQLNKSQVYRIDLISGWGIEPGKIKLSRFNP
jgi:competence protein ComEC